MAQYMLSATPATSADDAVTVFVRPTPTPAPTAPERILVERRAPMMGTTVSAQLATPPTREAAAQVAADRCMAWFAEVNARLSRFDPDSEISRLNRAGGQWFAASPTLFAAVAVALAAAEGAGGLFDPTLLPQLEALGYDRDFAEIAHRETAPAGDATPTPYLSRGGWRAIALDPVRQRIYLPPDLRLDLGGIAKGWAADVAFERYCVGFPGALLNVGGDLRVHGGPRPGQAWRVGVRDPRAETALADAQGVHGDGAAPTLATITLSEGGLATSGAVKRWWLCNGAPQHHLLDPRTGRPAHIWIAHENDAIASQGRHAEATLIATATALAPTATQAEVAAKLAALRGQASALHAVDAAWDTATRLPADTNAALLLTLGTGQVILSDRLNDYLDAWATERAPDPQAAPETHTTPMPWLADMITEFAHTTESKGTR